MKTLKSMGWISLVMIVAAGIFVACGNSQNKKVKSCNAGQDSTEVIVQESAVVVEIDSIASDTTAQPVKK